MNDYKITKKFETINAKVQSLPYVNELSDIDMNKYVSSKALDGLFYMLGQEETNIRTNPKARVTALLKDVFK
jgi:5-methylcytosine-specific restriction endonuclease McrBC regulatory subunit McrC